MPTKTYLGLIVSVIALAGASIFLGWVFSEQFAPSFGVPVAAVSVLGVALLVRLMILRRGENDE